MTSIPSIDIPAALYQQENAPLLAGMLRGIEKECLRVTPEGHIALTPHPQALGSALTHPLITTDFSEALLEFITSPTHSISTLLEQLHSSHQFAHQHIGEEMLWVNSMPCMVGSPDRIPIAQYGSSNRGRMKSIYRVGLGHRYGRAMQTVAGIHFNFSMPHSFWAFLHQHEGSIDELDTYTTKRYFDLIRNFRRNYWLLIYLFGASPAMCRSFVNGREHNFIPLKNDGHTLHLPYATSLRMGDLGYQSSAQENLHVCYNNRANYVKTLGSAIATPYPPYAEIGLQDTNGGYRQLNCNLLQIENEFYGSIRPKRTANKGETALTALCMRGVEYIEVRCLDLNPFAPLGVTEEQIRFLDTFLLYCTLKDSPLCDAGESKRILANQKLVVNQGRKPKLELQAPTGGTIPLSDWGHQLMEALHPIALLLDQANNSGDNYLQAWKAQKAKLENPELTPSAKVLQELNSDNITFAQWARQKSLYNKAAFNQQSMPDDMLKRFEDLTEESLRIQQDEEKQKQAPFSQYLASYYAQYSNCCGEYP